MGGGWRGERREREGREAAFVRSDGDKVMPGLVRSVGREEGERTRGDEEGKKRARNWAPGRGGDREP